MPLSEKDKEYLLRAARDAIRAEVKGVEPDCGRPESRELLLPRGAFVSLHKSGDLRGCIGTFSSEKPLHETVSEMAVSAATRDPRFPPLGADELDLVEIEISALTPLREVRDIEEIETGRHGIYIIKGVFSGVLLPQVAIEHGWDRTTFLDHTCMKAGLPPGSWKEGARILVFEAEIFSENGAGGD